MVKPCSRVFRKLSGELTIIQYWAVRPPPPDLRLRFDLPDFAVRSGRSGSGATSSGVSAIRSAAVDGRPRRPEVLRLGKERAEVADLRDMTHLVLGHRAADLEQSHVSAARIADRALPLASSPTVQQVHRPPSHARKVLERLLHWARQLEVVAGVDRGPDVG